MRKRLDKASLVVALPGPLLAGVDRVEGDDTDALQVRRRGHGGAEVAERVVVAHGAAAGEVEGVVGGVEGNVRGLVGGPEEKGVGALGLVAAFAVGVEKGRGWGGRAERLSCWFVVDCDDTGGDVEGKVPDF